MKLDSLKKSIVDSYNSGTITYEELDELADFTIDLLSVPLKMSDNISFTDDDSDQLIDNIQ